MGKLIYSAIASLDGYIEDASGNFQWGAPDEEVHSFINDLERPVDTYLYGRRMYETMRYWEDAPLEESVPVHVRDFARLWRAADKIVYSRTLTSVSSARTRIEPRFDAEAVRAIKTSSRGDLTVGGAEFAGQTIAAGLVDELQLFVVPVVVGGGKPWLPDNVRLSLDLLESYQFASGVVFLRYRPQLDGRRADAERR
jgi:dihydrofolate reductase